jgi:hypothetical protein
MREVATLLSISRSSVQALIDMGDLDAHSINPTRKRVKRVHVRVTRDSLLGFYQKRFGSPLPHVLRNPFSN